jgi:hypothetical protein
LRAGALGSLIDMSKPEDRQIERKSHAFLGSGGMILGTGVAVTVLGVLIALLGTATAAWVKGLGIMVASLGVVAACLGLALLVVAAVTHRMARHRPFA